jgi:glycosyltransferase involved in cell wall biosynthesis
MHHWLSGIKVTRPLAAFRQPLPGVSVIIPAYNAAATLEVTLNSVVRQTHAVWEAVIVDDGSTDGTRAIAEGWARRDRRLCVLHQENSGRSEARNRGLADARYPFVLFLDSDDRIAPTFLERMVGMVAADSTLDTVHCGWQRILPSGIAGRPYLGSDEADLFEHFAFHCHFSIHACVLRRSLALAVGGFDVSLTTSEDWDFFQRVARAGARFGRVPEVLAFYHIRAGSLGQDQRRALADARVVIDRGHARDPRMRIAASIHAEGRAPAYRGLAIYNMILYCAAQEIGAGRDGLDLLDGKDLPPAPDLSPARVADMIEELVPTAAGRSEEEWFLLWDRVRAPLAAFLTKLEAQARAPGLAFAAQCELEKKVVLTAPGDAPFVLGRTYRVNVDLAKQVGGVCLPPETDRLICRLTLQGKPIGVVEVPGAGTVSGRKIIEAASNGCGRLLLRALTADERLRLGLQTLCGLLRWRTLRLLYGILAAQRKDKLEAVSRLKHEAISVVKSKLSQTLAARPNLAAEKADGCSLRS